MAADSPAEIPLGPPGRPGAGAPELAVIMPAFNEEASLRKVVGEWFNEIAQWTENFQFRVYDDGSTDATPRLLAALARGLDDRLVVCGHANRGHGQTCLRGYREACGLGAEFVFQIDADGQCDPQYFFKLWRLRHRCDAIYGLRQRRDDGWRRVAASHVLRLAILGACGVWCCDANSPYRLLRCERLREKLEVIPASFDLANVALAVLLRRDPSWRHQCLPIRFRERYGGEPAVPLARFGAKAAQLLGQLAALPRAAHR